MRLKDTQFLIHSLNGFYLNLMVLLWSFNSEMVIQAKTLPITNSTLGLNDLLKEKETSVVNKQENSSWKECAGIIVGGITSARQLRGCNVIKGNLEIAIQEECHGIIQELEENLKNIRIIEGFLKILHSHPLTSLNFLKNLVEIRGNDMGFKDYSLVVVDNLNLQGLWNRENREPIKIGSKNGDPKILIHYNPKLCLQAIEVLRKQSNLKPFSNIDVSNVTNGDKVSCNTT